MAEKEYIEREAACSYRPPEKCERRYSTYNLDDAFENGYDEHIKQVEAIPAADVVEIPTTGIGDLSDGYHTFNGLYYQRMVLFAALVRQNRDKAWKSYRHEDGDLCFGGGWFIVGIDTPEGSYTYHYENKDFELFDCEELPVGKHWDGHTEADVTRLLSLPAADVVEVRWLPVVGYEGLYEVSNFGDVRCSDGTPVRQSVNHKKNTDYKCVWLKKNGVGKTVYIHRLVAEAFIPNPNSFPIVNHMDEDGTNNRADNLEWCTLQYNTTYGTAIERRVAKVRGRKMSEKQKRDISASVKRYQNSEAGLGKRVVCLETGEEFSSIMAAAEHFRLNPSTVGMCCLRGTNGRKYTFRYCNKMDGGANDG